MSDQALDPAEQARQSVHQQKPSIGRIVHYRLSEQDAEQVMRRRTTAGAIAARISADPPAWPVGAQAHIGNDVKAGDSFPMLIVRVWGDAPSSSVNGQVFLDGNDVLWVTSRSVQSGDNINGTWIWPGRT